MDTYHSQLQYAELAARMMKLGCYLFIAVVGLIGFMNSLHRQYPLTTGTVEITEKIQGGLRKQ